MRVIMLGAPGAGKGTQANILAQRLGVGHIASGDLFRRHQRDGTPLGLKVMEYVDHGLLVPDEITIAMMLDEVLSPSCQTGFVLDGFPRNLQQAQSLNEALAYRGMQVDLAILMEVGQEELVSRLGKRRVCVKCQSTYHADADPSKVSGVCDRCGGKLDLRADDDPKALSQRLQLYWQETAPLFDFYGALGKLVKVDGVGTVEDVRRRIHEIV